MNTGVFRFFRYFTSGGLQNNLREFSACAAGIIPALLLVLFLLTACVSTSLNDGPSPGHLRAAELPPVQGRIPAIASYRPWPPKPEDTRKTETYSVVVNKVQAHDLLFALARDAKLNIGIHPGIGGTVTLNAIDQTLPQLLARIAQQVDMRYELDGADLSILPDTPYLKNYQVDYVNMARDVTGTVSTNTQISTSALTAANSAIQGNSNTSRIQIENKSRNHFWESLEKSVKDLLRETDKVFPEGSVETVSEQSLTQSTTGAGSVRLSASATRGGHPASLNITGSPNPVATQNSGELVTRRMTFREAASVIAHPESGVLTVRTTARQHEKVREFIDQVSRNARRQVLIEATIVEVGLSDGYQQGIDWERLTSNNRYKLTRPGSSANLASAITPYVLSYAHGNPASLLATVDLLRSFGQVKVLSSPKLSVLNNQTATLKVTEDYVYFNVKSDTTTTPNVGTVVGVTTTPQSVSVGFFMSLTAQIGDNDMVTLNVRPSISSIAELKKDPNPVIPAGIPNFIPQIRTREIESLMRIGSGDIAVLGGLMEDRLDDKTYRVPLLGDVPVLGEIFNTRANASTKSELVILLRPTVIKDASMSGDYAAFKDSLPARDFFVPRPEFQPLGLAGQKAGRIP